MQVAKYSLSLQSLPIDYGKRQERSASHSDGGEKIQDIDGVFRQYLPLTGRRGRDATPCGGTRCVTIV